MSAVATKGEIKNLAARPGGGKTTTKRVAREKILAGIPIVTILTRKSYFFSVSECEKCVFLLGTSKIDENGPREAGNTPNRPSRIQWRNNFYNPFVWAGPRSSKVGYFDVN